MYFYRITKWSLVTTGCLLALSGCSPTLDWRDTQLDDASGLVASFPCQPERHERTVTMPGWPGTLAITLWSCDAGGLTWALSRAQVAQPEQARALLLAWPRWTRANLEAAAQQLPVARPVEVVDVGAVQVPGMTPWPEARAWWMRTERPDASGRPLRVEHSAWHFAHGQTVFQAAVWRAGEAPGTANGEDVTKAFLHSFQFRP